jgi:methyltransferase family protein
MSRLYDHSYFERLHRHSLESAREVVPVVLSLIQAKSIVDVGSGTGAWLSVFQEYGISDIWGVDGDYVSDDVQTLDPSRFLQRDLSKPFSVDRNCDLVVCLEVAEHLPPESASSFIESISTIAPVVLFSAAIPKQGGTGHINEQWPDYWAAEFRAHGFVPIDCIRPRIWSNQRVMVWFRQNILMYVGQEYLAQSPTLQIEHQRYADMPLSVVHPEMYLAKCL